MYISLDHGHLSPGHYTSQNTLHHTSSPALNCLQNSSSFCVLAISLVKQSRYTVAMRAVGTEGRCIVEERCAAQLLA
jgi:hypothetical protein